MFCFLSFHNSWNYLPYRLLSTKTHECVNKLPECVTQCLWMRLNSSFYLHTFLHLILIIFTFVLLSIIILLDTSESSCETVISNRLNLYALSYLYISEKNISGLCPIIMSSRTLHMNMATHKYWIIHSLHVSFKYLQKSLKRENQATALKTLLNRTQT